MREREEKKQNISHPRATLGPVELPITSSYSEYVQIVDKLPEDKPSMFGLPENIMQSYQRTRSTQTINQLRALMRSLQGNLINFYNVF